MRTGKLSFLDLIKGIDFLITCVEGSRHKFIVLQVTGPKWAAKDKERHPEVPVVSIDSKEKNEDIKKKIMLIIKGW